MGIGVSVFLLALGAILAFAVTVDSSAIAGLTIEWDTVGVILMIVGAIGLAWSLFALNAWRDRRVTHVDDTVVDRERIIER